MHSRIFQISKNPIEPESFIHESKYYDSFVNHIADYVSTISTENLEANYEWLNQLTGLDYNAEDKTICIKDKKAYFTNQFNLFKQYLETIQNTSIETFITPDLHAQMYSLKSAYDDEYGFYIDDDGEQFGLMTLDDFVRHTTDGDIFYLGAVIGYHY